MKDGNNKQEARQAFDALQKQEPQEAQTTQNTPDLQEMAAGMDPRPGQPDELRQLMQLPVSEIEKLPEEKQQLVWAEAGRQVIEAFQKAMQPAKAITEAAAREIDAIAEMAEAMQQAMQRALLPTKQRLEEISERINKAFGGKWDILRPYCQIAMERNPTLFKDPNTPAFVLIAEAAELARDDGHDIPLLPAEVAAQYAEYQQQEQGEQPETKTSKELTVYEVVECFRNLSPKNYIMPNNRFANALHEGLINAGAQDLLIKERKGASNITTYTMVEYEPDNNGILKLTEYERNVSNAVISIWTEAERQKLPPMFTVDMVYRSMPGGGETPSAQQREAITKTLEKFRKTNVVIDATMELRQRGAIGPDENFTVDESYFMLRRATRKSKTSTQYGYILLSEPMVYQYAKMTNQILSASSKYLSVRKVKNGQLGELVAMTTARQAMTGYMLRRIKIMQHDEEEARKKLRRYDEVRKKNPAAQMPAKPLAAFRTKSDTILFDTLFKETENETDDRTQAKRNRKFCYQVLEFWKISRLIKGYKEKREGRKITGVTITV